MNSHKLLVFDISSEYGHFRKFNTTSSPLTYAIPTRSALAGMIGAILGVERENAQGVFPKGITPVNELFAPDKCSIAIQILHPVKKVNIGFNLLNTGKSVSSFFNIQNRTQIEFELLKNPKYRVFFDHVDANLSTNIANRIRNVDHHFTPYLGLSQFTAIVNNINEVDVMYKSNSTEYVPIHTAINLSKLIEENPIQFETDNFFYSTDTMPMAMRRDRVITKYAEILIELNGNPIKAKASNYWATPYGNITFL